MNILREVHSLRRVSHSIRYSVTQRTSFLIDVLQACWLFDVCTAFKVKVQKIEIFTVAESATHSKPFSKGYTGLSFVCWLIDWLVLTGWFFNVPSLNNCLWDALLQIDAKEHSRNRSVRLCVLSDFTNGKRPFRFAVKRTNVLSLLCYSGHLSDGTHMGVHPCQCFTHNWKYFQDNILVSTDHESAHSSGH